MANDIGEFVRNHSNSYVLLNGEFPRPFFVRERITKEGHVNGHLLHEATSKVKREQKLDIDATLKEIKFEDGTFSTVSPTSMGVNTPQTAVYLKYEARRQFNKGWTPNHFTRAVLHGDLFSKTWFNAAFDPQMEISYAALTHTGYPGFRATLDGLERGDFISRCFSKHLAMGWKMGVTNPVLYHRGLIKGIVLGSNKVELLEDIFRLKEAFARNWGVEAVKAEIEEREETFYDSVITSVADPTPLPHRINIAQADAFTLAGWADAMPLQGVPPLREPQPALRVTVGAGGPAAAPLFNRATPHRQPRILAQVLADQEAAERRLMVAEERRAELARFANNRGNNRG